MQGHLHPKEGGQEQKQQQTEAKKEGEEAWNR
jgi:hypothetical protein